MGKFGGLCNIFNGDCSILFFILVFLLLFTGGNDGRSEEVQ